MGRGLGGAGQGRAGQGMGGRQRGAKAYYEQGSGGEGAKQTMKCVGARDGKVRGRCGANFALAGQPVICAAAGCAF